MMFKNVMSNMSWKEFSLGVLVGASGAIIINHILTNRRLAREMQQLATVVRELRREFRDVKGQVSGTVSINSVRDEIDGNSDTSSRKRSRPRTPGGRSASRSSKTTASEYASIRGSSSEDEFEEAYEGFTSPAYPLLYKDAPEEAFRSIANSEDEVSSFVEEIDGLLDGSTADQQEALRRMLANEARFSSEKQFMWRLARVKILVAETCRVDGDVEEQKRLVYEARENARAAIDLDDDLAEAHKYYAITQGIITDWVSFTEAATLGKEYKAHIERAIELKPREAYLNHLYGRFLFSVANLGWMQRKAAVMMYALPQGLSLDDALTWFEKAEDLEPGFSNLNPFYSAKCYIAKGQTDVAVEFLQKAISTAGDSYEENEIRNEAKELLQQYQ